MPNEILVAFHRVSNYDYHFFIKKSENEFAGQFECLGEKREKHRTVSFTIKK